MSDSTDPTTAAVVPPARPRTIELVIYLLGAQIVIGVINAIVLRSVTSTMSDYLFAHARKKDGGRYVRSSASDRSDIAHAVHQQQTQAVLAAVVFGLALAALAWSLRRYRSASVARWALVVVMVLNGGPLLVIPVTGYPAALNIVRVVSGLVWLAVLVLLFVPDSRAYFRACRQAVMPAGLPERPARPGLRDLFGGRGAAASGTSAPTTSLSKSSSPASARATGDQRTDAARPKAKSRSDEAAVAKGAELARARAKASKSRKSDV